MKLETKLPKIMQYLKDGKFKTSPTGMYTIQVNNSQLTRSWVPKQGCGLHICSDLQVLGESEEVEHGRINLIIGNMWSSHVRNIGTYSLVPDGDVRIDFINWSYS